MPVDPVCKMTINEENVVGKVDYKGQTFYFCSIGCKASFQKDPEEYLGEA